MLAATLTALGYPMAVLWQVVTPRVEIISAGSGWAMTEHYPSEFVEADLSLVLMGLIAGLLAAVITWTWLRRWRGPTVLLGLVLGSLANQIVIWRYGVTQFNQFWDSVRDAPEGWHMWRPAAVKMVNIDVGAAWHALADGAIGAMFSHLELGVLAGMPFMAAFVYTGIAGWSRYASLRPE